jgi:hypothetical protein
MENDDPVGLAWMVLDVIAGSRGGQSQVVSTLVLQPYAVVRLVVHVAIQLHPINAVAFACRVGIFQQQDWSAILRLCGKGEPCEQLVAAKAYHRRGLTLY